MASENLAALILAFRDRDAAPSFFRMLATYKTYAVSDLWSSIVSDGWDRDLLHLPANETKLVRDALQGILERDDKLAPMLPIGAAVAWDDADKMIAEIARLIKDEATGVYRTAMKAKHGLPFTWSMPKYGSTLCFVDEDMVARNVIVSVKQTKTLLHAIDLACTASQRLATTAFGLAVTDALYPPATT